MDHNAVEPISELKSIVAKPQVGKKSPWYARKVIRRISVYVTWCFLHTNATANQVTILQNVVGFIGFLLLCSAHLGWALLGIALIQLSYVLDCVDGEIARYRKASSVNGIFLDFFNHVTIIPLIPVGLGFHYYAISGQSLAYPILGVLGGLFSMSPINLANNETMIYLITKRKSPAYDYEKLKPAEKPGAAGGPEKGPSRTSFPRQAFQAMMTWSGYAIRYPGIMNLVTLLLLAELFLPRDRHPLLLHLFTLYVVGMILREVFLFSRYVHNSESEKKYLQIHHDFHATAGASKPTPPGVPEGGER
jgi:hypothetical protein